MMRTRVNTTRKWTEYVLEILVIVIGILGAFALNNWRDTTLRKKAEIEILLEIKSNLEIDLKDLTLNQKAHLDAISFIDSIRGTDISTISNASMGNMLHSIFRDFLFLPQTGAFETLKSKGVDLLSNDSLRMRIIHLYDFNYSAIVQLEADYQPNHFYPDYRYIIEKYYERFDPSRGIIVPKSAHQDWITNQDIQIRFDNTRKELSFILSLYEIVVDDVKETISDIDKELDN